MDVEYANRDLSDWPVEKAQRIHGTTHERVDARFEREKPYLLRAGVNWPTVSIVAVPLRVTRRSNGSADGADT